MLNGLEHLKLEIDDLNNAYETIKEIEEQGNWQECLNVIISFSWVCTNLDEKS